MCFMINVKLFLCSFIFFIFFVGVGSCASYPSPSDSVNANVVKIVEKVVCGGCLKNRKCYNIGSRTLDNEYCDLGGGFVNQKRMGVDCFNDFECESNKCNNGICEQRIGIKIKEIYKDNNTLALNLMVDRGRPFNFYGFNKNIHSVGFVSILKNFNNKKDSIIFLINDKNYNFTNRVLFSTKMIKFYLNEIIFNESIPIRANITFIESKVPSDDGEYFLEQVMCVGVFVDGVCRNEGEIFEKDGEKYFIKNFSVEKYLERVKDNLTFITGAVVGDKTINEGFFIKFLNWFKERF